MILIADKSDHLSSQLKSTPDFADECIWCDSFYAAIEAVKTQRAHLVIVADELCDRLGLEFLSHLQINFPKLPTIFVTDDSRKETVISAMRCGAKDFLEAPVDVQFLTESIRRVEATYLRYRDDTESARNGRTVGANCMPEEQTAASRINAQRTPSIEVFFFGSFKVSINGQCINHWPSRKGRSLFAYLAYNESKAIFREQLIDLFWPKVFPESGRNCLNVAIHHIRQLFQKAGVRPNALLLTNDCYSVNPELPISSDVKRFLIHWNRSRFLRIDNRPSPAVNELELAASLYKGDFIQDDIYEEWTVLERENLRETYLQILETLSRIYSLNGNPRIAIEFCRSILERDNCREKVHRRLMLCYHRIGERDQAIRQFKKCTEILKRELDVGPSANTVELYRKIREDTLDGPRRR